MICPVRSRRRRSQRLPWRQDFPEPLPKKDRVTPFGSVDPEFLQIFHLRDDFDKVREGQSLVLLLTKSLPPCSELRAASGANAHDLFL